MPNQSSQYIWPLRFYPDKCPALEDRLNRLAALKRDRVRAVVSHRTIAEPTQAMFTIKRYMPMK